MDERVLEALKESIAHWEENLSILESNYINGLELTNGIQYHGSSCALCKLQRNRVGAIWCQGRIFGDEDDIVTVCPIYQATGETTCDETPWYDVNDWMIENHENKITEDCLENVQMYSKGYNKGKEVIQAEIDFLKSLLQNTNEEKKEEV